MMRTHIPMRMCIACRNMKNQPELLRVVKDNETHEIVIDKNKKCFGRGAYVCADEKCIRLAMKKKGFQRHLKSELDDEIYNQLINEVQSKDDK